MASVSKVAQSTKQPYGGYLKSSDFDIEQFDGGKRLNEKENISPQLMGIVVDYLTRFMMTGDAKIAFEISLKGAMLAASFSKDSSHLEKAVMNFSKIKGLDAESISNACQLVGYDTYSRDPLSALLYHVDPSAHIPDDATIENISVMVNRCIAFLDVYGPVKETKITFETNGYTQTVDKGDADILTELGLWDIKTSKHQPQSRDRLQLLMYWIMGKHSRKKKFRSIKVIGMFNPRLNTAYVLPVDRISRAIIKEVEQKVIVY